jgi:DNA-binding IclR family transcriptional regulator
VASVARVAHGSGALLSGSPVPGCGQTEPVPEQSLTLDRGVRLLELLAASPAGLTTTQAAAALGLHRPVVHRLLVTLEQRRLARRGSDGLWTVGFGVLGLAQAVQPMLRRAATPVLRRLAEDVGATAHVTVADGDEALAVAVVEPSWTAFHVGYRVGARHSASRGAAGRAIALGRGDPGARDWVVSTGELQPGAHGVAAPVRDVPGMQASVGVVALEALDADAVGPVVVTAAAALSRRLRA